MSDAASGHMAGRLEDHRFLTGAGCYTADINDPRQLHMAVVRSSHGHAEITSISFAEASAMPGVAGIHVEADISADDLGPMPCIATFPAVMALVVPPRPALARGRVRHVGDPVAIVIAETPEAATAAAEMVEIGYRSLPAVVGTAAALESGAPQIWDEAPGNLAFRAEKGDRDATISAFEKAAYTVELDIVNNRVMAAPVEPRAGIGRFDPETGVLELMATVQGVHGIRRQLAYDIFRVPEEQIKVVAPDVGGGFGLKNFLYPEWILLLWAARRHCRPIKWVAERSEDHAAAVHGRDIVTKARLALDANGRFLALQAELAANMGAYLSAAGPNAATNASGTAMGGIYDIPLIYTQSVGVFTNQSPIDAYRGAGKPEANFIIERLIDVAARRCGFDPVELRLLNAIDRYPHVTAQGMILDSGRFRRNIEDAVRHCDRAGFEERREASRRVGKLRGLGFGCFIETSRGVPREGAEVRFTPAGRVELRVGTESNGQGHETTYIQIASRRLGLPEGMFDYIQADTSEVRDGHGHGGARSMHMGGGTMVLALDEVIEKARRVAATLLQTGPDAIVHMDGLFTIPGSGRAVTLLDVAAVVRNADVAPDLVETGLDTYTRRENVPFTFPNGCHVAEVEVDPDTGSVEILRYIIVDDYGTLINPQLTEGQVQGGIAQGIGQALAELVAYENGSGQLLSGTFMDYTVLRAGHLPGFETHLESVPTTANALGVKGSGQAGAIGAPQTVINAVLDALTPLGIDHIQMPAGPQTIWQAIHAAQSEQNRIPGR